MTPLPLSETVPVALGMVFVLSLIVGYFVWLVKLWRRARERLQELQAQDEALSRRLDELTARFERLETADRLDHLSDLVSAGVRSGRLDVDVGRKLEDYLQDLRSE